MPEKSSPVGVRAASKRPFKINPALTTMTRRRRSAGRRT
jgi:hypothetical protein